MDHFPETNNAPDWIKGTFIWRLVVPDGEACIERSADAVRRIQNLLDNSVRSCVITSGLIGVDASFQNWDGPWPYLNRATYRAGHDWKNIARFMAQMRDKHNTWISFHTNITDVNVGLREYSEMREFFEKLRAADAIFTRDGEGCGVQLKGPAHVPQSIPFQVAKMPYVEAGDPADIFAIVNYKNFWESGLAKEMIDEFFNYLPYPPLMLYMDVLTTTGNNLTAGLPDGLLGGSEATQREGREQILNYIRSKGTEPGGEGPSSWTNYNWNHGGMSANDYSRIETGWAQGCMAWRGAEWQHVHGNIGAYSLDVSGNMLAKDVQYIALEGGGTIMTGTTEVTANTTADTPEPSGSTLAALQETAEWRGEAELIEGFYLTAIQEMYHIGLGNVRLPGGAGIERLDEHRGRLDIDRFDLYDGNKQHLFGAQASDAELTKPCTVTGNNGSTNGLIVTSLDGSLAGRCRIQFELRAESAGDGFIVIRYISPLGGTSEVEVNGESLGEIEFPATPNRPEIFSDFSIPTRLRAGTNTVSLSKGSIHAQWSDGTQVRWDRNGFRAWNGDIVFGDGYNRMWPDTWSGQRKIYFYSQRGTERSWKLPADWAESKTLYLVPLTAEGRGENIALAVQDGQIAPKLSARQPYILEEAS